MVAMPLKICQVAGLVGLICRFFYVIASFFIASRIKKRELVCNPAAIAAILM